MFVLILILYNICKKYANNDNRIKVIHQENHGISYVRNFGVKLAKVNYIFWIDSDDYIKENIIIYYVQYCSYIKQYDFGQY